MKRFTKKIGVIYRLSIAIFFLTAIVYLTLNLYSVAIERPIFFQSYLNVIIIIFQALIVIFTLIATFYLSFEKAFQRTEFLKFFSSNKRSVLSEVLMEIIKNPTKVRVPIIVPIFYPLCDELHHDSLGNSNYCRETRVKKPMFLEDSGNLNDEMKNNIFSDGILKYKYIEERKKHIINFFIEVLNGKGGAKKNLKEQEIERIAQKNYFSFSESVLQKNDEVPMYSPVIVKEDFDCFRSLDRLFIKKAGSNLIFIQTGKVKDLEKVIEENDTVFMVGGNRSNVSAEYILEKKDKKMFYVQHGSGNVDDNWILQVRIDPSNSKNILNLKCSGDKGLGIVAKLTVNKKNRGKTSVYMIFGNTGENTKKMGDFIESQFDMIFSQFFPYLKKSDSDFILICGIKENYKNETFPVLFLKENNDPLLFDKNFLKDLTIESN